MTDNLDINTSWEKITTLSSSMHESAAQTDWHTVTELAVSRHQHVNQHFERFPVSPDTAEYYLGRLNSFLSSEETLQQLAKEARKNVMQNGAEMLQGKKARQAYLMSAKN